MVGGGFVRDALLGGRPGDIDVWLPSNITIGGLTDFIRDFSYLGGFFDNEISVVFRGPGHESTDWTASPQQAYSDINNHWVLEVDYSGGGGDSIQFPKVNFMRTMVNWEGDAQAFFNGLMRSFDFDICMMFMAWMPGEAIRDTRTVILPQHLAVNWSRPVPENLLVRLNELKVNQARANATSATRLNARLQKMYSKYALFRNSVALLPTLRTEEIVATPVSLSRIMRRMSNLPRPTYENSIEETPIATGPMVQTQR